jgi:hypothetical protein
MPPFLQPLSFWWQTSSERRLHPSQGPPPW